MVEKKGRGGGESSSLQRWKKVAKVAREEKTREAETKLDSRKRLVSNYPRSRASRATDVAPIANVTTVQTPRRFPRLITLGNSFFRAINSKFPSSLFLHFVHDPCASFSTLQNSQQSYERIANN